MVRLPPSITSENPIPGPTSSFNLLPFRSFLVSQNYSDSTIRNYIVDVNRYLKSLPSSFTVSHIFSAECLSAHLSTLTTDSNYHRYLSALNLFCQFALHQQLIAQNPLPGVINHLKKVDSPALDRLVSDFKDYLIHQNIAPTTIHNYINDLNQYITWLNTSPSPLTPPPVSLTTSPKRFSIKNLIFRHSES